jgi:beta-N-acetylhexosaminidase
MTPAIFGLAGPALTADERAFFAEAQPAGYILFKRNCVDRQQLRALTDSLRALEGREDVAILIDQEGGRVARMQPPEWPAFPAPGAFDRLYDVAPITALEAARVNAHALGLTLAEVGVTVDCLPLLDVRCADTHQAIGDRALGGDPAKVASLGRAVLDGLTEAGVVGVVKHMPGQGRATSDSHLSLPRVGVSRAELERDFEPFRSLANAAMGMTGHVVFDAVDPNECATTSRIVIEDVIRGSIGFDGLLMSDDLDMQALEGPVPERARRAVAAGCDLALNCWGRMDEMLGIAKALPPITPRARERLDRAMAGRASFPGIGAFQDLIAKRDRLLWLESGSASA